MLDVEACRYIKNQLKLEGLKVETWRIPAGTYAIEVARICCMGFQEGAYQYASGNVKSLGPMTSHLDEMQKMLEVFHPQWDQLEADMLRIENVGCLKMDDCHWQSTSE